ncbi:MAG: NADPH-dependent glutamate synthase [Candidatus Margulisbacteria bacterium]|nr:NADPH-dependent glutamate synthase [Candidatus Margulisiibacteriota bacterium]MBU1021286.1 NADPH-dependent glutamate synthase [Candidatus Margulisiibacteriota bacterium]MBU1729225.1 NADPH-dependent glutamate synthase [Candidatus Margulisiibacteriota bacterium]MBU1954898.1 NADPH-dependent glutamate synthase [Candidatus Margulisiibacteriota bacterium]
MTDDINKRIMPEREADNRIKDFEEVALGISTEQAVAEAKRCIQCKKPFCVKGCPVEIDIPAFILEIAKGNFDAAAKKLKEKNALPAICGRVCPQEDQCEKVCILGKKGTPIRIGYLERFAADWERTQKTGDQRPETRDRPPDAPKMAVVGSGPAGLTCASELARKGYAVSLFESLHLPGGVLSYGIPEFRLPKEIVRLEVEYIQSLGVDLQLDVLVGKTITIQQLFDEGYKSVFLGAGAGLPRFMRVPGENLKGVYSANEFLVRVNLMKGYKFPEYMTPVKIGKKVAVIGAGNVAMDAARCSLRLGADEVTIVYRRTEKEMPARIEEIERAKEEGIKFVLLNAPTEVFGDENGWVKEMECLKMELGEPDSSGRRRPVPIEGSEYKIQVDTIIVAIGQTPNPLIPHADPRIKTEKWGGVIVDDKGMSSIPGVFSGGDLVRGAATVISAMGDGKQAAIAMDAWVNSPK